MMSLGKIFHAKREMSRKNGTEIAKDIAVDLKGINCVSLVVRTTWNIYKIAARFDHYST